jgi:hypothetical protein
MSMLITAEFEVTTDNVEGFPPPPPLLPPPKKKNIKCAWRLL